VVPTLWGPLERASLNHWIPIFYLKTEEVQGSETLFLKEKHIAVISQRMHLEIRVAIFEYTGR
jgi:hypothetical protein